MLIQNLLEKKLYPQHASTFRTDVHVTFEMRLRCVSPGASASSLFSPTAFDVDTLLLSPMKRGTPLAGGKAKTVVHTGPSTDKVAAVASALAQARGKPASQKARDSLADADSDSSGSGTGTGSNSGSDSISYLLLLSSIIKLLYL